MAERLHIAQSAPSLLRDYLRSAFPRINLVALRKESVLKRQLKEGNRFNAAFAHKRTKCAPISHEYVLGEGPLIEFDPAKMCLNDDGKSSQPRAHRICQGRRAASAMH
jgi:hypothetical protein